MFNKFRISPLVLAILIFFLALVPRLYKLPANFLFSADEEYQATYARTIAEDFHVVWIGVSAANTGFYLGPGWTYLTALLLKLSHGDPLITGYFSAILGSLTAALIYLLGKELVGKRAAMISSVLYTLSPLVVYFDQKFWNPSALPLLALLLLYSSYKNLPYLFAICAGLVLHAHLSLVPLILVLGLISFKNIFNLGYKKIVISVILFLTTISPLIAFDYFHKGSNLTTPLRYKEIRAGLVGSPWGNAERFVSTLGRLWYLSPGLTSGNEAYPDCVAGSKTLPSKIVLLLATMIIPGYILYRQKNLLLLAAFFAIAVPYILYPGVNFEYYLLGIFPLYFLMVGSLLSKVSQKLLVPLIIIFAIISFNTLYKNENYYGLGAKKSLINQVMAVVGDSPFSLVEEGVCHRYEGWRYLFTVYGKYPVSSSIDGTFGWLYPKEIGGNPLYNVVIYGTGNIPELPGTYLRSGGFTGIITKF